MTTKAAYLVLLASVAFLAHCQDRPGFQPRARGFEPRIAEIGQGEVAGKDARGRDYDLISKKGEADLKLQGGRSVYETEASGNRAVAKGARGKTGTGTKVGSGGTYDTPAHKGNYRTSKQGNDKLVNLDSNGRSKLDVTDSNGEKNFIGKGNRRTYGTDPDDANFKNGKLSVDNSKYNYAIDKTSDGKATAQLNNPQKTSLLAPKGPTYTCTTQSDSITNCKDLFGRKVGEVRGSKSGNVVVSNSLGIPVNSANVTRDSSGKQVALVNGGIFKAETEKQRDFKCPGFNNDKVKLGRGITFKYANQQRTPKGIKYDWPACFDASIPVTLGPGILGKNVAFKWISLILPAGRLNCQDPATIACGAPQGECYYCDMCDPVKRARVQLLNNAASNICEAKGGDTFTTSATICPPPEAKFVNYCDSFSKGLNDPYWKKQGNLDVTFQVFNRKSDQDYANLVADRNKKADLVARFKKANPAYFLAFSIPDEKLREWYKLNDAEMIGCRKSVVNYNLSGGASTGVLLDVAAAGGAFQKNPCPPPGKK